MPNAGRLAGAVDETAGTIELAGHGLSLNDSVSFRAEAGGSLPSPLAAGVGYFAIPVDDDHFRVALSSGGAALDLYLVGARVIVIVPLPILAKIEWATEVMNDLLPAAIVPLTSPYPPIVRMTCAEIAAGALGFYSGGVSKSLTDMLDAARKRLERWARGVPIRGTNAPSPAGLSAAVIAPYADGSGWARYGGIR